MYEIFEHTADLGVHVRAESLATTLADAARGLTAVIAGDPAQIRDTAEESFTVAGTDPTWLLYDWLGEILAAFDLRRMLFATFTVKVTPHGLTATARGERYDSGRHVLAHEVKAITQHELAVHETPHGWEATFIVDI